MKKKHRTVDSIVTTISEGKKKYSKISRSRPEVANKVIAFEEIISSTRAFSKRKASAFLDVPNSTMQYWRIKKSGTKMHPEISGFLERPAGQKILQNLFMAHYMVSHYEITKATSAGLAAQERKMAKELEQAEASLAKATKKHGEKSIQVKEATAKRNLKRLGHQLRKERFQKVKNARKELGKLIHPIDLTTGKVQIAEKTREKCNEHLRVVEKCVEEAELSGSSKKGIGKRAFEAILGYVISFLM